MSDDKEIKGRSIYEIIQEHQDKEGLTDDELSFIWAMGLSTWEDNKKVTWGSLLQFVNNEGNFRKWMDKFEKAYDGCSSVKEELKKAIIIDKEAWDNLSKVVWEWREFKKKIKEIVKDK